MMPGVWSSVQSGDPGRKAKSEDPADAKCSTRTLGICAGVRWWCRRQCLTWPCVARFEKVMDRRGRGPTLYKPPPTLLARLSQLARSPSSCSQTLPPVPHFLFPSCAPLSLPLFCSSPPPSLLTTTSTRPSPPASFNASPTLFPSKVARTCTSPPLSPCISHILTLISFQYRYRLRLHSVSRLVFFIIFFLKLTRHLRAFISAATPCVTSTCKGDDVSAALAAVSSVCPNLNGGGGGPPRTFLLLIVAFGCRSKHSGSLQPLPMATTVLMVPTTVAPMALLPIPEAPPDPHPHLLLPLLPFSPSPNVPRTARLRTGVTT